MAPSAESSNGEDMEATTYPQHAIQASLATTPSKNVAFAVNYELPMVDQFLSVHRDSRRKSILRRSHVENPTKATLESQSHRSMESTVSETMASPFLPSGIHRIHSNLENDAPNISAENSVDDTIVETRKEEAAPSSLMSSSADGLSSPSATPCERPSLLRQSATRRISTREKNKREVPLARTRVKYDMQLVPSVRKNAPFLQQFAPSSVGQPLSTTTTSTSSQEQPEKRRSSRFLSASQSEVPSDTSQWNVTAPPMAPFAEDMSVVWIPTKRSEWEDTISEMTAVCTSAAMRRAVLPLSCAPTNDVEAQKSLPPFQPPLSRDYIRDRIDIDDPLNGYQIRHRYGGWMQGFILYTTFTTWTYGFRWDSQNPLCGIAAATGTPSNRFVDQDGVLAMELESLPRSGDPGAGGIVFPAIAEIGLLGGLGCGEYLLRMALDDISTKAQYQFVILQATEQSRTFYERFGFVRVGAICQYGGGRKACVPPNVSGTDQPEPEVVGYRHWTHANESEKSLQMHGGPSYMMCLKLPDRADMEDGPPPGAFVDALLQLRVETKPRVEQLGASTTPGVRRSYSMPIEISASFDASHHVSLPSDSFGSGKKLLAKRGPTAKLMRRKSFASVPVHMAAQSLTCDSYATEAVSVPSKVGKASSVTTGSTSTSEKRPSKRMKVELKPPLAKKRGRPATKSQNVPLSAFAEKQFNSIWLAVPPVSTSGVPPRRRPPKSRDGTVPSLKGDRARKVMSSGTESTVRREKASVPRSTRAQPVSSKKRSFLEMSAISETDKEKDDASTTSSTDQARSPVSFIEAFLSGQSQPLCRMALRKQKVVSYPRNRVHFYNRVVRRKDGIENQAVHSLENGTESSNLFFFVLEYHEDKALLCLIPLAVTGKLTGKRVGRPRYQCTVDTLLKNFVIDDAINYIVVPSAMIMKTPVVAQEAWDIATETDVDFLTR